MNIDVSNEGQSESANVTGQQINQDSGEPVAPVSPPGEHQPRGTSAQARLPAGPEAARIVRGTIHLPRQGPAKIIPGGRKRVVVFEKGNQSSSDAKLVHPIDAGYAEGQAAQDVSEATDTHPAFGVLRLATQVEQISDNATSDPLTPYASTTTQQDGSATAVKKQRRVASSPRHPRASVAQPAAPADPGGLLNESQLAALLGLEPATLRNWRVKGQGPRWVQLSRRAVRYRRADIDAWVASRTRRSTSETGNDDA